MKEDAEVKYAIEVVEYIIVSDTDSEVLMSSEDRHECLKLATEIRKCGGQVTIFKSTKL